MRIGIIGAGNIGGTLTRRLTTLGHEVHVANSRGPETLVDLARETGATAATTEDALSGAELVIVAIPERKVPDLPARTFERRAPGAPIVDTGNYYPRRDGRIDAIEDGLPESRWVELQIGQPVVKAFNTIRAAHLLELGRPAGEEGRIALPVAGDDGDTKQVVMSVVEELGFDAVDAGGLDDSWRQQPSTPGFVTDLDAAALRRALEGTSPRRSR
jgi:8-hydroxy-5-deazaflavin:NADPH oxidoreductase